MTTTPEPECARCGETLSDHRFAGRWLCEDGREFVEADPDLDLAPDRYNGTEERGW